MIQRLHGLQSEMHEEYLKDEAAKAEENKRNFSMFGSPSKMASPGGAFMSPKGKLPKAVKTEYCAPPARGETHVSFTKMEKSPTKEITKDPEKLATIEEYASVHDLSNSKPDIQNGDQHLPDEANISECSVVGQKNDMIHIETVSSGYNKPTVSHSQIPGCSKQETHSVKQIEDEGSGPENSVNRTHIGIDNTVVNSEGIEVENKFVNNLDRSAGNLEDNMDSEDDERYDDITVEDRRARLKRTLSPSFFSEDVYRLKYPRTTNDSFICKYFQSDAITYTTKQIKFKNQLILILIMVIKLFYTIFLFHCINVCMDDLLNLVEYCDSVALRMGFSMQVGVKSAV